MENSDKILKNFWSTINNRLKVSLNILSNKNVDVIDCDGKEVISINVPRTDRREKPIYIGQNPMTGTYRRNYEGDYKCTIDEVKACLLISLKLQETAGYLKISVWMMLIWIYFLCEKN